MDIKIKVNGTLICESVSPDLLLLDFLRKHGCYSVKRGCETANCGLCTVLLDETPVLSCSVLCEERMDMKNIRSKDCRRKHPVLLDLSLTRGLISVDFAIRDLS